MSPPFDIFEIELPRTTSRSALEAVRQEIATTEGVERTGGGATRSLDAATLTMWVTLTASAVTTVGAAIPVVKQVLSLFKKQGIKGVKLRLADGSVLEADEMSAEDLAKLMKG